MESKTSFIYRQMTHPNVTSCTEYQHLFDDRRLPVTPFQKKERDTDKRIGLKRATRAQNFPSRTFNSSRV